MNSIFQFDFLNGFYKPITQLKFIDITIATGVCAINYWGLFFYNQSLRYTQAGITIILACIGTVTSIIFSIILYGEKITYHQAGNFLALLFGIWLLENLNSSFLKVKFSRGVGYALLSVFFWSTWFLFPIAFARVGVLWFCCILECTVFTLSLIVFLFTHQVNQTQTYQSAILLNLKWIVPLAVLGFGGVLFSNLAMVSAGVANYAILGLVQPLISLFFTAFFFRERLTRWQYAGVGVILLVLFLN